MFLTSYPPLHVDSLPELPLGWRDLPSELLEKVFELGGRRELKVMREVCPEWKTAFDASVPYAAWASGDSEDLPAGLPGERFHKLKW